MAKSISVTLTPEQRAREFVTGAFGPFGVDQEPYVRIIKELIDGALESKDAGIERLQAELDQSRTEYQRICRGDARLRQERDEARAEIERLQNQLGQAHARIETDGREIEQLRAALDKAEKHMRSIGFLETADKLKRALEQEAGETKP